MALAITVEAQALWTSSAIRAQGRARELMGKIALTAED